MSPAWSVLKPAADRGFGPRGAEPRPERSCAGGAVLVALTLLCDVHGARCMEGRRKRWKKGNPGFLTKQAISQPARKRDAMV